MFGLEHRTSCRLRIHHVERGGYALAADVCDHEREVRLVEHEEIVEVAADIPRRGHGRRQAEIGVFAKRHGQYGILDRRCRYSLVQDGRYSREWTYLKRFDTACYADCS